MSTQTRDNNKRIAKNTMLLYVRMFVLMAVNLFTSRVVLQCLGVEDFGIYGIVGSVVTLLRFLIQQCPHVLAGSLVSILVRTIT